MGVLGAVVFPHPARAMNVLQTELADRGAIGRRLVRGDRLGLDTLVPKQLSKKLQRGVPVPPLLHQNVEDHALVIDRAPQPHLPSTDPHEHLVEMPATCRR
jgi:hypothetical protein